jgi:hypothetical protein
MSGPRRRISHCISGPSTFDVTGLGRSSTMNGMPRFAASSIANVMVQTYV